MQQAEVEKWVSTLKVGDEVGVFSGSRLLFKANVAKRTPSGRVICELGGTFKANGDIHGRLADQDRRLRPVSNTTNQSKQQKPSPPTAHNVENA